MRQYGETKWLDVVLDTDTQEITVVQRWKYIFVSMDGIAWSKSTQNIIKSGVKDLIYMIWNQKAYAIINTNRGNRFNQLYGKKPFTINFKIESVTCGEHWTAVILKNPNEQPTCQTGVYWDKRHIFLNDCNFYPNRGYHAFVRDNLVHTMTRQQCAIAHEFGHTIGNNNSAFYTGDEYIEVSKEHFILFNDGTAEYPIEHVFYHNRALYGDTESIMNIGNEVRHRHFAFIRDVLQDMFPGSYFSISLF